MSFSVSGYSPTNLASLLSEAEDKHMAPSYSIQGISYDEAMNFAPQSLPPMQLQGQGLNGLGRLGQQLGAAMSMNPVFYVLAAAALGYIFFVKKEQSFGYY